MVRTILILFIICLGHAATGQTVNSWKTLGKVTLEKKYDEFMDIEIEVPKFSDEIIALSNKEIEVKGYFVPLEGKKSQSNFMFSAYPYNMCFFCGGAGPESVMQVFMENDKKVAFSDKPMKLKGVLQLSFGDVNNMMYTLVNAQVIK